MFSFVNLVMTVIEIRFLEFCMSGYIIKLNFSDIFQARYRNHLIIQTH